jgi:hypothetical protein
MAGRSDFCLSDPSIIPIFRQIRYPHPFKAGLKERFYSIPAVFSRSFNPCRAGEQLSAGSKI